MPRETMPRETIHSDQAPNAMGPYSQAIRCDGWVFCAGQVGLDPATGGMVAGGVAEQTRQVLRNLQAVLDAAGCSCAEVVKTTVYLRDLDDFAAMNEVYAEFFPEKPPARATVQVSRLPAEARVEIDAVASQSALNT